MSGWGLHFHSSKSLLSTISLDHLFTVSNSWPDEAHLGLLQSWPGNNNLWPSEPHVQCILWLLLPCWHESNRTSHQNDHPWAHFTREGGVCEGFDPTARQVELVVLQPWGHGSSAQQTHKKYKELIKKVCPNSGVVLLSSSCSDCYYMKEGFYMKFTAIVYCVLGDDACSFPLSYWVGSLLAICMPTCVD